MTVSRSVFTAMAPLLLLFLCTSSTVLAHGGCSGDVSWIQAYNAGLIRTKANKFFQRTINNVDPMLLSSLRALADCPAVPSAYPFPARVPGSRLDTILKKKVVKVAVQDLKMPVFEQAFVNITKRIVHEMFLHYKVKLTAKFTRYPDSETSVKSVIDGKSDVTDPFYRQWTLMDFNRIQRSVQVTPACTIWAPTLSISWLSPRNNWQTFEDIQAAGSKVVIPLYSSVLPFKVDVQSILPKAKLLARPNQNFESDVPQLRAIFKELMQGKTTAVLAAKSDIEAILSRANLTGIFPLDQVRTVETKLVLPVGAFLPLPGAVCDEN